MQAMDTHVHEQCVDMLRTQAARTRLTLYVVSFLCCDRSLA